MGKDSGRLYSRAAFLGFRRGKSVQNENQALVQIEGVKTREDAKWYLGKRVAYVYKGKKAKIVEGKKHKLRCMWGKVVNVHGTNGVVRAKFNRNLPSQAMGSALRVMLYPHRPAAV